MALVIRQRLGQLGLEQRDLAVARFSRSSPSANSNAWSPKSSWTWSKESPKKNWKMKTGSTWWLGSAAEAMNKRGFIILEFLDTNVFDLSVENCVSFWDPLIESWDIDLETFGMEIVLNHRVAPGEPKKFEFVEKKPE